MRKLSLVVVTSMVVLGGAGCYHATVETGATPSTQVIAKPWAAGWVLGLVPPSTVQTAAKCPQGVAKVETQLSFLNQVVGILTIGIYTPMSIEVTCAASKGTADAAQVRPDVAVSQGDGSQAVQGAFMAAAERAAEGQRPVYVEVR